MTLPRYAITDAYTLEELRREYQGSNIEGRIGILQKLYEGNQRGEGRAPYEIALLALDDPHVEVRRWIAKYGKYLDYSKDTLQHQNLEERLKEDPDPFIRACLRENPTAFDPWSTEVWMNYFKEATPLERLALMRNPQVASAHGEKLVEAVFNHEDQDLGISLKERQGLVYAFLTNKEALAHLETTSKLSLAQWPTEDYGMNVYGAKEFLKKLWALASQWPKETKIQSVVYRFLPADDKTKADIYQTCNEPVWRHMILENCDKNDKETIQLGINDSNETSRHMAEWLNKPTQGTEEQTLDKISDKIEKKFLSLEQELRQRLKRVETILFISLAMVAILLWRLL